MGGRRGEEGGEWRDSSSKAEKASLLRKGDETGADRTNVKGAVRQSLFRDPAFQEHTGVHLDVVCRGPVVGLFAMVGWTARDWAELRRECQREAGVRSARGGRDASGGSRRAWRGGRRVLDVVVSVPVVFLATN